jgi:hypothetical protein
MPNLSALLPEYRKLTLEQAQSLYASGYMGQEQYELYCYIWRNGAVRFSDNLIQYEEQDLNKINQVRAFLGNEPLTR